ncbi:hypothetical protein D3C71_2151940 [compost metagenome]
MLFQRAGDGHHRFQHLACVVLNLTHALGGLTGQMLATVDLLYGRKHFVDRFL